MILAYGTTSWLAYYIYNDENPDCFLFIYFFELMYVKGCKTNSWNSSENHPDFYFCVIKMSSYTRQASKLKDDLQEVVL